MAGRYKNGMLVVLFTVLAAPLIQHYFPFITSGPLYGFNADAPDEVFNWDKWWDGSYQEKKGRYLNDHIGFRADLIRLNNQLDYSLLNKLHSWKVVEGKDHYLFMDTYINGYYGRDYVGYTAILEKLVKLKALSDTFERLGKSLILIHAPAKEFMYPENIPDEFKNPPGTITNLATYNHISDSLKIHSIDFNRWFYWMKNESKDALFPRQGVHWSVYGSYLAADSLIRYIEALRHIRMPHAKWSKVNYTDKPCYSDDDIAKTLNLIYPITHETFSYPEVYYTEPPGMVKPNIVYIGDSFLPIWVNDGIMDHINNDWQVWQWFTVLWSRDNAGKQIVDNTDWHTTLKNTDCIVIMYTSFNLPVMGNGFIEKAYDFYFPVKK